MNPILPNKLVTLSLFFLSTLMTFAGGNDKPRVFILTDINIDSGDPDDRQSLVHLFWYANELEIEGVIPERWNARSYEACQKVLEAYRKDYREYDFKGKGYPAPPYLESRVAKDSGHGEKLFLNAAKDSRSPLYVLVWGNMLGLRDFLFKHPAMSANLRVISIGTGVMMERHIQYLPADWEESPPCKQMNWNAFGRNEIFTNPSFDNLWWLEINWTYEGMFTEPGPTEMLENLSAFGSLGKHLREVVKNEEWAQYFRVGDTPSVLYLIDPDHNPDRPEESSWAGRFHKPFPDKRPNYFTDISGNLEWDYDNPCNTWDIHEKVRDVAAATLEKERKEMYDELLEKLGKIYKDQPNQGW